METQPMFDIPLLDEAAMQLANIKKRALLTLFSISNSGLLVEAFQNLLNMWNLRTIHGWTFKFFDTWPPVT